MRLYLSSYRLGNHPRRLKQMVGEDARVLVVANGLDAAPPTTRQDVYERTRAELESLGLRVFELDLRCFFGSPDALRRELAGTALLWATGGNVFTLSAALRASGLASALQELASAEVIVYGGYSAGAVVAASSLRGIELVDSPEPAAAIPPGYPSDVSWEGHRLLDFMIVPHFRSDHWESAKVEAVVTFCREHRIPHCPLRDGEVLVVDGASRTRVSLE